jgi:carotenoid cleavage dioxygenase-like enzyme
MLGKPFMEHFRWEPDRGTRFHLFDREGGELVRSFDAPPGFCFHHVNAYEDGDEVVIDATAPGPEGTTVGFGEVRGRVLPAYQPSGDGAACSRS